MNLEGSSVRLPADDLTKMSQGFVPLTQNLNILEALVDHARKTGTGWLAAILYACGVDGGASRVAHSFEF